MCTKSCLRFGRNNIKKEDVENKRVIEIGSYNVNGSLMSHILSLKPSRYVGVDIRSGPCVDVICSSDDLLDKFGKESFDFVLTTETIEHIENWRKAISNFKNICIPGGVILVTTCSRGFGKHDYPNDYWRYEIEDMKNIFEDCAIEKIEKDPHYPGIFVKVRKQDDFIEKDLSGIQLFRIV